MNKHIYIGFVRYDAGKGSVRPALVFKEPDERDARYAFFPILSAKDYWTAERKKQLFEITNLSDAHLEKTSYIDMSIIFVATQTEFLSFKKIGELSFRDAKKFQDAYVKYRKNKLEIDEIVKTQYRLRANRNN